MDDLILKVDALEEAQEPFEADLPRELLDSVLTAEPPTEFHAAGASHLNGKATKLGSKVLVQARFTVPLAGQCRRCLKPLSLEEPVELTREYVRQAGSEADPEEEVYSGKEINLTAAVREQILLSIPPPPLCVEDCKGLCPSCGKDLNEGPCGCENKAMDPRWSALKGLRLDPEKANKEK